MVFELGAASYVVVAVVSSVAPGMVGRGKHILSGERTYWGVHAPLNLDADWQAPRFIYSR